MGSRACGEEREGGVGEETDGRDGWWWKEGKGRESERGEESEVEDRDKWRGGGESSGDEGRRSGGGGAPRGRRGQMANLIGHDCHDHC